MYFKCVLPYLFIYLLVCFCFWFGIWIIFFREREREKKSKKAYDKIGPIQGAKTGFQKWVLCISPLHHSLTHRLSGLGSRPANSHRGNLISFGQCFPKYQIYSDGKGSFVTLACGAYCLLPIAIPCLYRKHHSPLSTFPNQLLNLSFYFQPLHVFSLFSHIYIYITYIYSHANSSLVVIEFYFQSISFLKKRRRKTLIYSFCRWSYASKYNLFSTKRRPLFFFFGWNRG